MPPLRGGAHSLTTATMPSSTAAFQSSLAPKKVSGTTALRGIVLGPQRAVFDAVSTDRGHCTTDRLDRLQLRSVRRQQRAARSPKDRGAEMDLVAACS